MSVMADIAVVLHWPPSGQMDLTLEELMIWYNLARERSGAET
jgi:hypothetical protein